MDVANGVMAVIQKQVELFLWHLCLGLFNTPITNAKFDVNHVSISLEPAKPLIWLGMDTSGGIV